MGAAGAGARRFGTALLGNATSAAGTLCTVTNLGSKAVSLGVARVLNLAGDPSAPAFDECSMSSLEPFETCRITGEPSVGGGAYVEVLGDSRGLRGHCIVFDASGNPIVEGDMR
jgi:hypothetical protein